MKASSVRGQKGAAALAFIAVFVIFCAVFHAVFSYGLPELKLPWGAEVPRLPASLEAEASLQL